jgi:y4mF family transcriptional regulator
MKLSNYTFKGIIALKILILYLKRYKMSLSQFLKTQRKAHQLRQEDLAAKAGVGLRLVREIEQGKTTMRMDKVNQILAVFGATLCPITHKKNGE